MYSIETNLDQLITIVCRSISSTLPTNGCNVRRCERIYLCDCITDLVSFRLDYILHTLEAEMTQHSSPCLTTMIGKRRSPLSCGDDECGYQEVEVFVFPMHCCLLAYRICLVSQFSVIDSILLSKTRPLMTQFSLKEGSNQQIDRIVSFLIHFHLLFSRCLKVRFLLLYDFFLKRNRLTESLTLSLFSSRVYVCSRSPFFLFIFATLNTQTAKIYVFLDLHIQIHNLNRIL